MTRVVKLGGRAQADGDLAATIARAWRAPAILCLVHGGGDEVSALQRRLGRAPAFVGGRRVTTAADIELLRMTLSGAVNKRLVSELMSAGVRAVGLSGEDAAMLTADPIDLGVLGLAGAPAAVDPTLLRLLLDGGFLPVVSPVARATGGAHGGALNVNGDDAAAAIAVALGATELLLIADVPGVLVGGAAVPSLDADDALALVKDGTAGGGMAAKLESAVHALERGVPRVRIGDLAALEDSARGTIIMHEWSAV